MREDGLLQDGVKTIPLKPILPLLKSGVVPSFGVVIMTRYNKEKSEWMHPVSVYHSVLISSMFWVLGLYFWNISGSRVKVYLLETACIYRYPEFLCHIILFSVRI